MNSKLSRIRSAPSVRKPPTTLAWLGCLLLALAFPGVDYAAEVPVTRVTALLPDSTEVLELDNAIDPDSGNPVKNPPILTVSGKFRKHTKKVTYLQFSAESLPKEATIVKAALRLVQKGKPPNYTALTVRLVSVQSLDWQKNLDRYENDEKFNEARYNSAKAADGTVDTIAWTKKSTVREAVKDGVKLAPAFLRETGDGKKYIALLLLPPQVANTGRAYSPVDSGGSDEELSNQPRLILTYTVPRSTIPRGPDSQSDGRAAMRSPRAFIPKPNVPRQEHYTVMPVVDGTKISSYTFATFGGLTYVVQKYADKQNNVFDLHLDALEPLGGVVWPKKKLPSPLADDKVRVVVNESGRLTISGKDRTSKKNRFIVYQLNTAEPRKPPETHLKNKTVDGVKSPQALLPGPDGSLYVIGDTDIYALNPDLQILWRTSVGTSASARMTLSPDGQFVYVVSKAKGLLTINAQTGKSTAMSDFSSETKFFHRPVVVRRPNGADFIYIAANSQNNGVLRTVKNTPQGEVGNRVAELKQVNEEKGFFSQPAPDATVPKGDLAAKKLRVVWKEDQSSPVRLVSINAKSGKIENRNALRSTPIEISQGNKASFEDASWLWSGGNLAMDKDGNIVFWENGTLYGFPADDTKPFADRFDNRPEKWQRLWTNLELLFGSEGTLYAQDSSNGALSALIPSYELAATTASTIASPTHLRVDGVVTQATTLSAGGSVLLGKGFKVKNGTTFTVRTNSLKK